jgi:hypothetical protein
MCGAYVKEVALACCVGELCYYAGMVLKLYVGLTLSSEGFLRTL